MTVRLARVIEFVTRTEIDIEDERIRLARNSYFDPFQTFRKLDLNQKGFLNEDDIGELLRSFNLFFQRNELQDIVPIRNGNIAKITFQDFIRQVQPLSNQLLKNDSLNRIKRGESGRDSTSEEIDRSIARIYQKEIEYYRRLAVEKSDFISFGMNGLEDVLMKIIDSLEGRLTLQSGTSVSQFMKNNNYAYHKTEYDALIRRVDIDKRGDITLEDLEYFLFPEGGHLETNYSSIGRENSKHEIYGSMVDSFSSPMREITGVPGRNIKINENYIPSYAVENINPNRNSSGQKTFNLSPNKLYGQETNNGEPMSRLNLIDKDNNFVQRQSYTEAPDYMRDYQFKNKSNEIPRARLSNNNDAIRENLNNKGRSNTYYSERVAAIKNDPLYQPPSKAHNTPLESQKRTFDLGSHRSISRGERSNIVSTYTPFDTRRLSDSQYQSGLPSTSSRANAEVENHKLIYANPLNGIDNSSKLASEYDLRYGTRPYSVSREENKKIISVSPIKSRLSIETSEVRPLPNYSAGLGSKLKHDPYVSKRYESVSRLPLEPRESYSINEMPIYSSFKPMLSSQSSNLVARNNLVYNNYKFDPKPTYGYNLGSEYGSRQPYIPIHKSTTLDINPNTLNNPLERNLLFDDNNKKTDNETDLKGKLKGQLNEGDYQDIREVASGVNRAGLKQTGEYKGYKHEIGAKYYNRDDGRLKALSNAYKKALQPSVTSLGALVDEPKQPITVETYKLENENKYHLPIAAGIARTNTRQFAYKSNPVKYDNPTITEVEVSSATSYKFANQKYEQLWNTETE